MLSKFRLTCLHEAFHVVGARTQGIATRSVKIAAPGSVLEGGSGRAAGRTCFGMSHAQLPKLGAPAAIALLAGGLGEKFCGGPDWLEGSRSDFKLAVEALRFTDVTHEELVTRTERIVREGYDLASRLADWLEVYGSLDSTRIYRLCNSR
jgi:hypothetical protein